MSDARLALRQALALGALSVFVAAAVHFPLIGRFIKGEFRETFFQVSAFPGIRLITLEEAEDLWAGGASVLLDARPAALYAEGHMPGARSLPASDGGFDIPAGVLGLARDGTLVIYCEGGDCQSSLALAKRLHEEGFTDIRVLTGGWKEWKAGGLPEEKKDGQE